MKTKKLIRRYRIPMTVVGLIVVLGITLFFSLRGSSAAREAALLAQQQPTATSSLIFPEVNQLLGDLNNQVLSGEARDSLEEKLRMAERMASEQAAGASLEKKEKNPPPLPQAPALIANPLTIPDQIFEGSQGMIRPSTAEILNCWQGARGGRVLQVFAGASADHPEQGLLIVFIEDPQQAKMTTIAVDSPAKNGALRILEVKENIMTLQAGDGSQVPFNLETLQFQ
jgi:hypothetical protein